mmetsp:Transcript_398/g.436  ORF Transcript_398/g.436 Transcript_398/m.436 type:complete len:374 (-) Transcript_398:234-1355(-)|eukprot:CAMPEP_0173149680 /NCGR_PEP_ID=MMETSP1105-20130129/10476_1 /TAXON_ID=2985 /ORGANISM="Ochromonas sp., Strain BG-1" /LENGTH=373 /DNA_ID=CAMNT_0014064605 /DNA_START=273 /DNA_END=1394 /DNA_ORIENTATION=-
MSEMLSSILSDSVFTPSEREWLVKFNEEVTKRIQMHGVNFGITMFSLADAIGLDLTAVHKEGPFMFALWVILLSHFQIYLKLEDMKFPVLDQFLQAYEGRFTNETESEIYKLWQVANWMNILFKMISARKNKGLAMQVVPKLIEGWDVKYVTGSGQTRFTANRVHIFEVEGNVKANHRSKSKSGKRGRAEGRRPSQPSKKDLAGMIPKRRRRGTKSKRKDQDDDSFDSDKDMVYVYNDGASTDSDDDDSSVNEEIKEVFEEFVCMERDETSGPELDLIREISNLRFDDSSAAVPIKREVTWTEIMNVEPVCDTSGDCLNATSFEYSSYNSSVNNSYQSSHMVEYANTYATLSAPMINDIFFGYTSVNTENSYY